MVLERGRLVLSKKGKPQIEINGKRFNPSQGEISQAILERLTELNGEQVEFEWEGGQPKKIREAGAMFVPVRAGTTSTGDSRHKGRGRETHRQAAGGAADKKPDFHNPYNFIPAPPRKTDDPDLGDHEPVCQDLFHQDRYTGRIRVDMKVITPLLVPDPESCQEDGNGHKTFALLLGKDGKPIIPPSSIRGMLRTAYEAVTNSRLGRFPVKDHEKRLACRMEAREGLRLIPARIENGRIRLLAGTSTVGRNGTPDGPQYAAWLPRYSGNNKATNKAVKYPDGSHPQHGDEVECWVELFQHHRWDKKGRRHIADFQYWKVLAIVRAGSNLPRVNQAPAGNRMEGCSWHESKGEMRKIRGWVCITNANIKRKHAERVFFCHSSTNPPGPFTLAAEQHAKWKQLIDNYQQIHEEDLNKRRKQNHAFDAYLGSEPGRTAWSRHVYTQQDRELQDGTLCYVRLAENHSDVEALFPVMIARELYTACPWELLDPTLRPATRISLLSPGDRVFGWVRMDSGHEVQPLDSHTAFRGLLRVGPVACESAVKEAVETFNRALPLAILAAPKPQQARFYVAASPQGNAQADGLSKVEAGYVPGKGLRGRKVYPHHHGLLDSHWEKPLEDRTQSPQGPWQEYRRPTQNGQEQRDDQNRSILNWVKPGSRFSFDIHVTNLSKVELGALLFLLHLPKNHFHRFGGGKPLGFGSVRLSVDDCSLWTGESLRERYCSWDSQNSSEDVSKDVIVAFKDAVIRAYGHVGSGVFEQVPFIKAFFRTCEGFNDSLQVHYPRVTQGGQPGPPNATGESFKWFVANEKQGARYALGDLAEDNGLPTFPDPEV